MLTPGHIVTGGGRQPLSARFVRHFTQLCIPPPSEAATKTILTTILGGFLADWGPELKALCGPLVTCATETYNRVCAELLPTPAKSHYTFNLRDLCKVAQVSSFLQCRHTALTSNQPECTHIEYHRRLCRWSAGLPHRQKSPMYLSVQSDGWTILQALGPWVCSSSCRSLTPSLLGIVGHKTKVTSWQGAVQLINILLVLFTPNIIMLVCHSGPGTVQWQCCA